MDHVELIAYRRVGDYPLYVATGYATSVVTTRWRHNLVLVAAIAALPCIAVWLLIAFSIRRLDAEQAAWERWQAEVATRLSVEASSRQLRRMGALGNLVANVAHDFNNLLMVVASNMELVRDASASNDVESACGQTRDIGRGVARAQAHERDAQAGSARSFGVAQERARYSQDVGASFGIGDTGTDNGESMSESVLRRAFELLFTTKERGAGTGLGLAQVMSACKQAGGTARITSVPGAGTTVGLYLPRLYGIPAAAPLYETPRCRDASRSAACASHSSR